MGQNRPPLDEQTARERLRKYVLYKRMSTEIVCVPHRIPPAVASDVIRTEVKADARVPHVAAACNVARFYVLRDCLGHFAGFLSTPPRDEKDAFRHIECVKVLGDVGDGAHQRRAADAFERLVQHRRFEEFAASMVRAFFHLGPDASPKILADRLEKLYQERRGKLPDPKRPDSPTREMDDLAHYKLVYVTAGKRKKEVLLGTAKDEARARGLARVYLGLDDLSVEATEWAGYALLSEAQRSSPDNVVAALQAVYPQIEPAGDDPELDEEHMANARARACDAIVYFGGALTDEQRSHVPEGVERPCNIFTPEEV